MWECEECHRMFPKTNQSHTCTEHDVWDLFEGKPDSLLLAFDGLMNHVLTWTPCHVGAAKRAVVFTNDKAWLVVRPMKSQIDLCIFYDQEIEHELVHKIHPLGKKFNHHIRIKQESELTPSLMKLLKRGYDFCRVAEPEDETS